MKWAALLVLAGAFGLRVFQLGVQSLWADEGYGLYLASEPLADLGRDLLVDLNHVPLYFVSLHGWIQIAGDSEFAVRWLSVTAGVLCVALTFRLGRIVIDRRTGLAAAIVTAVAPFQVYYSQEARMHIWTTAFCLVAVNVLISAMQRLWRLWAAYAAAGIAGLYTFYYAGFVLAGLGIVAFAMFLASRAWRRIVPLVLTNVAIGAAFAPWAFIAAATLYAQAEHKGKDFVTYDLASFLNLNWKTYLAGVTAEPDHLIWPIWPAAIAVLLGVVALSRSRWWPIIAGYLIGPLLGVFLLQLRFPHFVPRYLLLATPPFYLIIAAGLVWPMRLRLPRLAFALPMAAALVILLLTAGQSLANNAFDPAYARDDYRGVANTIRANAQPDDAIVLNAPWQIYNFPYYYRGPLPLDGLPYEDPLDPAITTPKLQQLIDQKAGVWLVLYGNASMDPTGYVERWLDEHSYKVDDSWYGTIRLARYISPMSTSATPVAPAHIDYSGGLSIIGYEVAAPAMAGDALPVRIIWQARGTPDDAYRSSIRLVDGGGRIWAQSDAQPLDGALPTDQWTAGGRYRDPRLLALPTGMPPGEYALVAVVYGDDGEVTAASSRLGSIQVAASPPSAPDPSVTNRVAASSGSLRLIGATLPAGTLLPGTPREVVAAVRSIAGTPGSVRLIVSRDGADLLTSEVRQVDGIQPGEPRLVPLPFTVPATAADGSYDVLIDLGTRVKVGTITVQGRPKRFDVPDGGTPLRANAGAGIDLVSATLPANVAAPLPIRLVWRANERPAVDVTAFIHVVDSGGAIVAQNDAAPSDLPSSGWVAGEVIVDDRRIAMPRLATGRYSVYTGLYRADGTRVGPGDGRMLLGTITVP